MKISKIGWVGKSEKPELFIDEETGSFQLYNIYNQGKRYDWHDDDWPPRKVKVTVEDVE